MRKKEISNKLALICLFLFTFCGFAHANKIIYVDDDAVGANDGSSWQNAYIYLQDALADANSSEKPVEIRVAQGTYRPDQGNGLTAGDREAAFQLISGVSLSGGFAGIFEPDPNEQDYKKYETILTGDLAGNDIETNDPNDLENEPTREDNSFSVITAFETDSASLLDGFSIAGGTGPNDGGGIRMHYGKLQIRNCSLINNFGENGAGICANAGQLTLINCIFKANAAKYSGGGIFNNGSKIKLVNCIFENNHVSYQGGGIYSSIYNRLSKINMENCIFKHNSAYDGGAMYLDDNNLKDSSFNNSLFIDNLATNEGGAIYMHPNEYLIEITNFTFAGNSALHGKAISSYCDLKLSNSILYNGGQDEIYNYAPNIEICYSNIQNGQAAFYYYGHGDKIIWGEGNIDTDPLFADPNNGDYHLKSQAGRWDSNTQSWVQDNVTSPCIDAGDPNSPIGIEPFPNGGYINMGAYGGTNQASKSYFGKPVCETVVAGDINGDCKVDELDMAIMMIHWLEDNNPVSVKVIDGVEFRVQTDKTHYKPGENVQMEFTITNLTNEDVSIDCYQVPELNLLVQKDGQQIWALLHQVLFNVPVIELSAGESKETSHSWNMKDDDGYIVGPGTYHIVGIIYNDLLTEVRIPITISASNEP